MTQKREAQILKTRWTKDTAKRDLEFRLIHCLYLILLTVSVVAFTHDYNSTGIAVTLIMGIGLFLDIIGD